LNIFKRLPRTFFTYFPLLSHKVEFVSLLTKVGTVFLLYDRGFDFSSIVLS
jgi:hypothetical protein